MISGAFQTWTWEPAISSAAGASRDRPFTEMILTEKQFNFSIYVVEVPIPGRPDKGRDILSRGGGSFPKIRRALMGGHGPAPDLLFTTRRSRGDLRRISRRPGHGPFEGRACGAGSGIKKRGK